MNNTLLYLKHEGHRGASSWEEVIEECHQEMVEQEQYLDKSVKRIFYMVSPIMDSFRKQLIGNLPEGRCIFPGELVSKYCQKHQLKNLLLLDNTDVMLLSEGIEAYLRNAGITLFTPSGKFSSETSELLMHEPYLGKDCWYFRDTKRRDGDEKTYDVYTLFGAIEHTVREYDIDAVITSWYDFATFFKQQLPYNFPQRRPREGRDSSMKFISMMDLVLHDISQIYAEKVDWFLSDWYLGGV